jgi:hypothetical protein
MGPGFSPRRGKPIPEHPRVLDEVIVNRQDLHVIL